MLYSLNPHSPPSRGGSKPFDTQNREQTMIYLEAALRHLPKGARMFGGLTNLDDWRFYVATGDFSYEESDLIDDADQVALFLDEIFREAAAIERGIDASHESRSQRDPTAVAGPAPSLGVPESQAGEAADESAARSSPTDRGGGGNDGHALQVMQTGSPIFALTTSALRKHNIRTELSLVYD